MDEVKKKKYLLNMLQIFALYDGHIEKERDYDELFEEAEKEQVQEAGFADRAGIRVGDVILEINGKKTNKLTLKEANTIVEGQESMDLVVTNLLDQEASELEAKMMGEVEEEELQLKHSEIAELDLPPPRPAPVPEQAQRKCWHPIMLDTNPPPIIEESTGDEEAPHKKILRNFRQAMSHKDLNPSPELQKPPTEKPPPPPVDSDEAEDDEQEQTVEQQLRNMQRQLAALASLPEMLQRSLAAVNTKICKLLPPDPEPEPEYEEEYEHEEEEHTADENSYEYELSREGSLEPEPETEPTADTEESLREPEPESEPEPEPEPEPTPEDLERMAKLKKKEELNKAWPWSNDTKAVYKISDRYKVPHSEMFNNTIQKMEGKVVLRKSSDVAI